MIEVPTLDGRSTSRFRAARRAGDASDQGAGDAGHRRPGSWGRAGGSRVETPRHLTARQEELLREFAEIEHLQVSPRRKSFFEKLRDYFTEEVEPRRRGGVLKLDRCLVDVSDPKVRSQEDE